ncbi:site-2 protease family protein [Paludisphaera mucosa]|uniref:Site-2 protease family protein n=1 Tax=Paludisphaera mucosa TaxID=3030827 RepID=A0ABT6FDZ6_9BACT|nr:site-2 protease family protein [Paludisphaera mucosa]
MIWLWNIAKVALGLGFVIFIHELGHFLLAKWNGVKVEKFSIGFGKTIFGFTRGETEYVLAAIPLGGFVKMLGEGGEAGEGIPDAAAAGDPRAFNNKPVGARMAIISAGVIMNLLLGMACFAYVFGREREEIEAKVGRVVAGSPAFEAGLRAGDEIEGIDGLKDVSYNDLQRAVSLSTRGQVIHFQVKREGTDALLDLPVEPRRDASRDRPTIGVISGASLEVLDYQAPAGTPEPATIPWPPESSDPDVLAIVAAGPAGEAPAPATSNEWFQRVSAKHRDKPLDVVFQRRTFGGKPVEVASGDLKATLPPNRFVDFGLRFAFEPIRAIQKGSPAQAAGFKVGDRIVKVDGRDDVDPLRLPLDCFDHAGSPMTFEVQRAVDGKPAPETVALTVTPDDATPSEGLLKLEPAEDLLIPGLGVTFPLRPVIQSVVADSPAAKAGLKAGDVIDAVTIPATRGRPRRGAESGKEVWLVPRPQTLKFDDKSTSWPFVFASVQTLPVQALGFTIHGRQDPVSVRPEVVHDWYSPDRGLDFMPAYRTMPPLAFVAALKQGVTETIDKVSMMYATIRSLGTGQVSFNQTAGPIGIGRIAYAAAKSGLSEFLNFLGFISINLAVLNFLPIPPLDGGQMLFLIAEKVRGRPLPESALIAGTYLGLLLVLFLMVFATYQDVYRLLKEFFL